MENLDAQPFRGMFDRVSSRWTGLLTWDFTARDTNVAASRLFAHLDQFTSEARLSGHVFLTTIELDAECGRFPEMLAAYFCLASWDYRRRFYGAPLLKGDSEETHVVGRLTFDAEPGETAKVLAYNGGLRWARGWPSDEF
jgi:hypothetical protein